MGAIGRLFSLVTGKADVAADGGWLAEGLSEGPPSPRSSG